MSQEPNENLDANDLPEEETGEFITLDYEDGTTERCEVMGIFELDDVEYIALVPESDDGCVYLYVYEEHEDGTFSLGDIADDELFAQVAEAYESLIDEDDVDGE